VNVDEPESRLLGGSRSLILMRLRVHEVVVGGYGWEY
jgi:hypothetical protein